MKTYPVSQYEFTCIMGYLRYNVETKEWELPGKCFKDFEADSTLRFLTKYAASQFVWDKLAGKV